MVLRYLGTKRSWFGTEKTGRTTRLIQFSLFLFFYSQISIFLTFKCTHTYVSCTLSNIKKRYILHAFWSFQSCRYYYSTWNLQITLDSRLICFIFSRRPPSRAVIDAVDSYNLWKTSDSSSVLRLFSGYFCT